MPASNSAMIHKLQMALNSKGQNILYNTRQFYSQQQNRPVTMYIIRKSFYDDETGRTVSKELFSSVSQIQVVLFLRDLWYQVNGKEIPHDNLLWEEAKKAYYEKAKLE